MIPDLSGHIGDIARRLLGEPNKALSTRMTLRFGNHGSIAVEVSGPKRGQWYDHEHEVGGGSWEMLHIIGGFDNGRELRLAAGPGLPPFAVENGFGRQGRPWPVRPDEDRAVDQLQLDRQLDRSEAAQVA